MPKPLIGPETPMRCVGRTTNLEEANLIAERYEAEGYETEIIKKKQGSMSLYEVWIGKKADVFMGAPKPPRL